MPGENRAYNTTVVFNRDGKEVARYRKIHMFDITAPDGTAYNESATIKGGRPARRRRYCSAAISALITGGFRRATLPLPI